MIGTLLNPFGTFNCLDISLLLTNVVFVFTGSLPPDSGLMYVGFFASIFALTCAKDGNFDDLGFEILPA